MNDSISRQAAIDAAVEAADEWDGGYSRSREEIITMKLRTVEAVPVIRCKDCKHYVDEQCDRYADETLGYAHSTQADWYCWVAERKEE